MILRCLLCTIAVSLFLGYGVLKGLEVSQLLNIQSLVIVFGGIGMVLWFGFSPEMVRETLKSVILTFRKRGAGRSASRLLSRVLELARIYRMHGPIALEKSAAKVEHDFLRFGATLIAEGYDQTGLVAALEREHLSLVSKNAGQVQMLRTLARLSPSLGMAGTVISLMQVMQTLGNSDSLGESLGLALSSTLYGIMLANLVFLPISLKLEQRFDREASERIMLTEALLSLHQGEHPLRIAEKLNSYELYCKIRESEKKQATAVVPINNTKIYGARAG